MMIAIERRKKLFLFQASTRLEEDRSELPQCRLRHPLSLTAGLPTRLLPLPMKPLPTRPQPAPSRSPSTRSPASQWRQLTTRRPLTLPSLPRPVPRLLAFPSHSVAARFKTRFGHKRQIRHLTGELLLVDWPGRR